MSAGDATSAVEFISLRHCLRAVKPETFENVFAPEVSNERLSVNQIIAGLSVGVIRPDCLPPDVQKALGAEIKRREKKQMTASMFLTLVLGTMGVIKYKLRLQKYVFLADVQFSQSRKGRKTTDRVYAWEPHHYGPFSENLETCVKYLVEKKIIETFDIHEGGKDPGVGYRLTAKGNAEFRRLLHNLEDESKAIHGLLKKFQRDRTENNLIDFVYKMHPEYTSKSRIRKKFSGASSDL